MTDKEREFIKEVNNKQVKICLEKYIENLKMRL